MVSAQDAAQTDATGAMNAGYAAQTGQFANRSPAIDPRMMGQNAYNAQMSHNFQASGYSSSQGGPQMPMQSVQGGQAGPAGGAQVGAMPQPSAYDDMLNSARLKQPLFQPGGGAMQPSNAAPIASPAPYNPNAVAQIGGRTFGGPTGEAFPTPQGYGFPEAPATQGQQAAFTAQTQPAPAPDLLRDRTTAEIAAMTPMQRAGLVQFKQEQAAATAAKAKADAPKPIKLQSYRSQDDQGNPIEVTVDDFGNPVGKGPVRDTPKTNINVGEGIAGAAFKDFQKKRDAVVTAQEGIANIDAAIGEIETGNAFSGAGANFKLQGAKIAQFLGAKTFNDEIAATEAAVSTLAQSVLDQAQNLPGPASDKDIKFLQKAATGGSEVPTKEALKRIREIAKGRLERARERYQKDVERSFTGDDDGNMVFARRSLALEGGESQPSQTNATAAPSPQAAQAPSRIRNPQTGEIRELQNGQWVPVK